VSDELIPNTKLSLIRYGLTQTYLEQSHSLDHRLSESIFCVSGVTSARGLDTFMSVVPYVKSRFPEARFFVGVRNDEEERRARLALRHGVELLRPKSLLEALNANSVVVLPFSKHMAVDPPLSMIESMAMGKPVISTRIGSIPETLGRDRGILVERDDPAGLGEAICRFLRDPELGNFFGDNAREYIVKTYNWTTALTNLLDVYRRLASDPVHLC